jgi:predicted MFS family arabinose efflux permease
MGLSIRRVAADQRATAMGLHQAVYAIGMFSGPWLSGILADDLGIQPMFGLTALACLLLGLSVTRWLDKEI